MNIERCYEILSKRTTQHAPNCICGDLLEKLPSASPVIDTAAHNSLSDCSVANLLEKVIALQRQRVEVVH